MESQPISFQIKRKITHFILSFFYILPILSLSLFYISSFFQYFNHYNLKRAFFMFLYFINISFSLVKCFTVLKFVKYILVQYQFRCISIFKFQSLLSSSMHPDHSIPQLRWKVNDGNTIIVSTSRNSALVDWF